MELEKQLARRLALLLGLDGMIPVYFTPSSESNLSIIRLLGIILCLLLISELRMPQNPKYSNQTRPVRMWTAMPESGTSW